MTKRFTTQKEHDSVINATSKAYEKYKDQGHIVSINLTDHPQHDVGNGNFPDLVVWRPGGDFGISEIIEEVETSETINEHSVSKWIRYSKFSSIFYLIVPKNLAELTKKLVEENNIDIDMIQCYEIMNENITFYTIHGKKLWPR